MKKPVVLCVFVLTSFFIRSQDTFSILAYDSLTREVGSAGASCLDLFQTTFSTDHFITEIFPDTGAIATQAAYIPSNQSKARARMRAGDSPDQILTYMHNNALDFSPDTRQYGAIRFGHASAAFTGAQCTDYKGHIVGPNYTIQGNILLGKGVLDSMEARFLRTEGDLACKLMAALQGAKRVGADTRCAGNNSSSLFAFLKVSNPGNAFGTHDLIVSLRTHQGDSIEPIDSLQKLFDFLHVCPLLDAGIAESSISVPSVHPNPASGILTVSSAAGQSWNLVVTDAIGRVVYQSRFDGSLKLEVKEWGRGLYFFEFRTGGHKKVKKVFLD